MTSPLAELAELSGIDEAALARLGREDLLFLKWQIKWTTEARAEQIPPDEGWNEYGVTSGRGFGKSRLGAEWLGRRAWEDPEANPRHVIAPTFSDIRFVAFEGVSGLLSVIPPELVKRYNASDSFLELTNGALIRGFSSEKPERLRGPQCADIWADELAAWGPTAEDCFDMAMFGLRLGKDPRFLWTSTPKPIDIVRKLTKPKEGRIIVKGSSYDNRANLSAKFFEQLEQYEGTNLGRQEIHGHLLDPEEAAIIKRSWFQLWPHDKALPKFSWIIMSMDTAFTEATMDKKKQEADPTACLTIGVFEHEKKSNIMVLDCWEDHLGMPELIKRSRQELQQRFGDDGDEAIVKPLYGSDKPRTSGRCPDILLIEEKGSGISLQQMLAREGIEAYMYNPGRADKLSRLHLVSPILAKKRVWLPESSKKPGQPRNWLDPFLAQVCAYNGPGSTKHDDFVDVLSQSLRLCMDKRLVEVSSLTEIEKVQKEREQDWEPQAPPKKYSNPYAA